MLSIFKKEIFRVFSDKKLIFSLFILPLVLVVGLFGLMGVLVKDMVSDVEEHVATVYVQNAPEEVKTIMDQTGYLDTAEVTYLDADASAEEIEEIRTQILSGETDLLVVFDETFMEMAAAYQNAGDTIPQVTVGYNSTQNYSSSAASNFDNMVLEPLQTGLLQDRFGNLDLLTVFNTNEELIVKEEKANGQMFAQMLPYMVTFMLFASAMSVCIDAIAGEKERGTMATMLLSPVKRSSIVFGKLFALSILSIVSSLVYSASTIFGMPLMYKGLGDNVDIGMNLSMSPLQAVELLVLMVSLVLFYVAAICLVSVFAKNAKEANTYVMPLYMLVLILGMMTMFNMGGAAPAQSTYAIPVYGTAVAIQGIVNAEITLLQFGMNVASNLICAVVVVFVVSKVFNNEKVMLNA
ncbi:MAG: ABC transporter permease [Lachnospiraceae bacterium]|nr:ABC transporter permease [Lachnospiraceae bacterium]